MTTIDRHNDHANAAATINTLAETATDDNANEIAVRDGFGDRIGTLCFDDDRRATRLRWHAGTRLNRLLAAIASSGWRVEKRGDVAVNESEDGAFVTYTVRVSPVGDWRVPSLESMR